MSAPRRGSGTTAPGLPTDATPIEPAASLALALAVTAALIGSLSGLFLVFSLPLAVGAIVAGGVARRRIRRSAGALAGRHRATWAMAIGTLWLVVLVKILHPWLVACRGGR
jgi:hypothetical protein